MEHCGSNSDAESFTTTVPDKFNGVRLDHYLVQTVAGPSRSLIIASIKAAEVRVNDTPVKAGYRLRTGDRVAGRIRDLPADEAPLAQPVDFSVLHEDPLLLVIAKPPGLVVHPGSGNRDNTLINGLLHRYCDIAGVGDEARPGIVHRLDKDTSGIMLIARTPAVHRRLMQDFKDRAVEKIYLALVHGRPRPDRGRIVAPIGRHPVNRQKMAVRPSGGRYAVSNWTIREVLAGFSLVEVHIETGRTHQIRVHLAHAGFPVAGDRLYGPGRANDAFPRQMLHAWRLRFIHPGSGEEMAVEAPLPADFGAAVAALREAPC